MDKVVTEALKPYENLYARIDDIEKRVNNKLRELSIIGLARFSVQLKQTQVDIIELKR